MHNKYNAANKRASQQKSQNWGSSFIRTKISREAYLLEKRTLKDLKYWEWIFIVVSVVGTLIQLGFNGYQFTMALIDKEKYLFPTLLIVNNLFSIYFLCIGVLQEQPFQILMQLIIKTIIWIFNLIYFLNPTKTEDETEELVREIRFYISSSMLFLTIPVGAFVLYQYWSTNLHLFKIVGTEPKFCRMYKIVFLGQSLIALSVDIQVVALLLVATKEIDLFAIIILPVGFFFILIWAFTGIFAIKKESKCMTYTFYLMSHMQPLYVVYLLVRSPKDSVGDLIFYSLIFVAIAFFITHISLLVTVVKIHLNYDKGLKQAAEKEIQRTKSLQQSLNGSNECIDEPRRRDFSNIETDI